MLHYNGIKKAFDEENETQEELEKESQIFGEEAAECSENVDIQYEIIREEEQQAQKQS